MAEDGRHSNIQGGKQLLQFLTRLRDLYASTLAVYRYFGLAKSGQLLDTLFRCYVDISPSLTQIVNYHVGKHYDKDMAA